MQRPYRTPTIRLLRFPKAVSCRGVACYALAATPRIINQRSFVRTQRDVCVLFFEDNQAGAALPRVAGVARYTPTGNGRITLRPYKTQIPMRLAARALHAAPLQGTDAHDRRPYVMGINEDSVRTQRDASA